jgi:hypothetical protein
MVGATINITGGECGVLRFTSSGNLGASFNLDPSFGTGGIARIPSASFPSGSEFEGMALEPDGRIVVAGINVSGTVEFVVARFLGEVPEITSFTASPNQVTAGSSVTLTASSIIDTNPNSTITQVAFYVDSNSDGVLDAGDTQLVGTLTQSSSNWTLSSPNAFGLSAGTYKLFAQAEDSSGVFGDPFALTLTVQ